MVTVATVIVATLLYVALLIFMLRRAERRGEVSRSALGRALVYFLSLTVYCTSWSYFASVGDAATNGWNYIAYYLGPVLAITLAAPLWRRIAVATKREKVGSIADFLASRYGKSRPLGIMVTIVCLITAMPHIALQLRALVQAWGLIASGSSGDVIIPAMILMAVFLGAFVIMLGGRRADLTETNPGLLRILAIQSGVKLVALVAVAVAALWWVGPASIAPALAASPLAALPPIDDYFLVGGLLGFAALYCFPRQFHVGFVELRDPADIRVARYLLPLYLLVVAVAVIPIVAAGSQLLAGTAASPSLYVLGLPIAWDSPLLLALVAVGAFSAASSMIVVETIALSAMISNEMVLPWMTWRAQRRAAGDPDFSRVILVVRRITMGGVLAAACIFLLITSQKQLASIGTASFMAAAQLLPALVGAVFWQRGSLWGAIAGIAGGMIAWLWCGIAYGVTGADFPSVRRGHESLIFTVELSLSINVALYMLVSLLVPQRMIDRVQARSFVRGLEPAFRNSGPSLSGRAGDLMELVAHFIGEDRVRQSLAQLHEESGLRIAANDRVTPDIARAAERMLVGAIGASSARGVVAAALVSPGGAPADIIAVLDDAAHAVEFNRGLLQATLDNLNHGVCVVDRDERLIVWNSRFLDMFGFSGQQIWADKPWRKVARHIDDACAADAALVGTTRLADRPIGAEQLERRLNNGRVLRIAFARMGEGGWIVTFGDITEDRALATALRDSASALERANRTLEARVFERTEALAQAKAAAERADRSKTRFLAAASHDLLQPLHAARLFVGALQEDVREMPRSADLAGNVNKAIGTADRMLRALLGMAKLDALDLRPTPKPIRANEILADIEREFLPAAREKGLDFRVVPSTVSVLSDRDLLRSLLQNLVANAIRYTEAGGVVMGCRREGEMVRIEIWDSGRGISTAAQERIFDEFVRIDAEDAADDGVGLGLSIADRIARRLDHRITVRSRVGRGSMFGVVLPLTDSTPPVAEAAHREGRPDLEGMRILCLDDDETILEGLRTLLPRWGAEVSWANSWQQVREMEEQSWDVGLIDYRIDDVYTGIDVLERIGHRIGCAAIVTADQSEDLEAQAERCGAVVLRKPIDPARLLAFLQEAYQDQLMPPAP